MPINPYKVTIIGPDPLTQKMFEDTGIAEVSIVENPLKEAEGVPEPDLVVFTGGSDVTPWLYGRKNTASMNNVNRDIREVLWFHRFINVPKVGICRGGQFLFTMNGGVMEQDIPGHGASHQLTYDIWTPPGHIKNSVTSTHHQHMAFPLNSQTVLAHAAQDGVNEVVWSPGTKSLSFQPHPEYEDMECRKIFFWYIERLFKYKFQGIQAEPRAAPQQPRARIRLAEPALAGVIQQQRLDEILGNAAAPHFEPEPERDDVREEEDN